ncbi:MAG: hypothetical protein ACU836_17975 [Gammaproteobacteria bacterium]
MKDKLTLLRNIKPFCEKLVVRINCQDASTQASAFGGTMFMISSSELKEIVEKAGWIIKHWKNIRAETLQSSIVWGSRLNQIKPTDDVHLETFRAFCDRVNPMLDEWSRNNPLIELVAV